MLASVKVLTTKLNKKMGQEAEVFINVEIAYHTQLGGEGCDFGYFYNVVEDEIWDPGGVELFLFSLLLFGVLQCCKRGLSKHRSSLVLQLVFPPYLMLYYLKSLAGLNI